MADLYQNSQIKVLIGPDFDGTGKIFVDFEINFSENKATEQLQHLKNLVGVGEVQDYDWTIVGAIQALPGQVDMLNKAITQFLAFSQLLELEQVIFETYITGDIIHVTLKLLQGSDSHMQLMEPFNMFFNQGLDSIATDQQNSITGSIKSNLDFHAYVDLLKLGERLFSCFFKSVKFDANIKLHKELAQKLRDIVQNFDPESANELVLIFFKMFRNFDLDLKFKNTDELPDIVKKNGLFGKQLQANSQEENKLDPNLEGAKEMIEILQNIGDQHEFWFTIPSCLALNAKVKATGLSKLIQEYGSGIQQML